MFYLNTVKEEKTEFSKDPNSKADQYCFETIFNGCKVPTKGFKCFPEKLQEQIELNTSGNYKSWNIEAKVNIPT